MALTLAPFLSTKSSAHRRFAYPQLPSVQDTLPSLTSESRLKDCVEPDLLRAIGAVAAGKPFFTPSIASTLLDDYMRRLREKNLEDSSDMLTDREKEVLQLLAEGKSNKEAAALLQVSPTTVETHRTRMMQKLNLHNTAEIVLYAVLKKIVTAE